MKEESPDDVFELYHRFNFGNNPAFDQLVKDYTAEASKNYAAGKAVTPLTEYVMAWVSESNNAYSHADFVAAIRSETVSIRWLVEPYKMIAGAGGHIFGILALLYQLAPFVIFPICAYMRHNWWLLLGVIVSRGASGFAARNYNCNTEQRPNNLFGGFLLLLLSATIAFWFYLGFRDYFFWAFAVLWGFTFCILTELTQMACATRSLIDIPEIFYSAIAENKILIERQP
jgi:hypothetical protein